MCTAVTAIRVQDKAFFPIRQLTQSKTRALSFQSSDAVYNISMQIIGNEELRE